MASRDLKGAINNRLSALSKSKVDRRRFNCWPQWKIFVLLSFILIPDDGVCLRLQPVQPMPHKLVLSDESHAIVLAFDEAKFAYSKSKKMSLSEESESIKSAMEKIRKSLRRWEAIENKFRGLIKTSLNLELLDKTLETVMKSRMLLSDFFLVTNQNALAVDELKMACPAVWEYQKAQRRKDIETWINCYSALHIAYRRVGMTSKAEILDMLVLARLPCLSALNPSNARKGVLESSSGDVLSHWYKYSSEDRHEFGNLIRKSWDLVDQTRSNLNDLVLEFISTDRLRQQKAVYERATRLVERSLDAFSLLKFNFSSRSSPFDGNTRSATSPLGFDFNLSLEANNKYSTSGIFPLGDPDFKACIDALKHKLRSDLHREFQFYLNTMKGILEHGKSYIRAARMKIRDEDSTKSSENGSQPDQESDNSLEDNLSIKLKSYKDLSSPHGFQSIVEVLDVFDYFQKQVSKFNAYREERPDFTVSNSAAREASRKMQEKSRRDKLSNKSYSSSQPPNVENVLLHEVGNYFRLHTFLNLDKSWSWIMSGLSACLLALVLSSGSLGNKYNNDSQKVRGKQTKRVLRKPASKCLESPQASNQSAKTVFTTTHLRDNYFTSVEDEIANSDLFRNRGVTREIISSWLNFRKRILIENLTFIFNSLTRCTATFRFCPERISKSLHLIRSVTFDGGKSENLIVQKIESVDLTLKTNSEVDRTNKKRLSTKPSSKIIKSYGIASRASLSSASPARNLSVESNDSQVANILTLHQTPSQSSEGNVDTIQTPETSHFAVDLSIGKKENPIIETGFTVPHSCIASPAGITWEDYEHNFSIRDESEWIVPQSTISGKMKKIKLDAFRPKGSVAGTNKDVHNTRFSSLRQKMIQPSSNDKIPSKQKTKDIARTAQVVSRIQNRKHELQENYSSSMGPSSFRDRILVETQNVAATEPLPKDAFETDIQNNTFSSVTSDSPCASSSDKLETNVCINCISGSVAGQSMISSDSFGDNRLNYESHALIDVKANKVGSRRSKSNKEKVGFSDTNSSVYTSPCSVKFKPSIVQSYCDENGDKITLPSPMVGMDLNPSVSTIYMQSSYPAQPKIGDIMQHDDVGSSIHSPNHYYPVMMQHFYGHHPYLPPSPSYFPRFQQPEPNLNQDFDMVLLIRNQIEYYFSDENVRKDTFLRSLMDVEGFVYLKHILPFNRIKRARATAYQVLEAVQSSSLLEIDEPWDVRQAKGIPEVILSVPSEVIELTRIRSAEPSPVQWNTMDSCQPRFF